MNEAQPGLHADHLSDRREARLRVVFLKEGLANLRLLAWFRTGAVAAVALWLTFVAHGPHYVENLISCALFIILGWIFYALSVRHLTLPWYSALFALVDALILIDNLLPIMPWNAPRLPYPILLRFGSFAYLFVPLALAAFYYSPWRTLWAAAVTTLAWAAAVGWIMIQPGAFIEPNLAMIAMEEPRRFLAIILNPNFIDLRNFENEIFILLLVGGLLAVVVWRSRELVRRQVMAERHRAHLARYFSPKLIDQLQDMDAPLGEVRTQPVAVLFADVIGFTRLSEHLPPERIIELLRSFHRRMARVVFAHDGTLDKYIGDAVMATFGVPRTGAHDALNALQCARAMIDELDRWNDKRIARGAEPVHVGIGVHFGPAVLGDIGDERRLEFAVIGDTVNVASRLERLTRALGTDILVSQDVVDAASLEAPEQTSTVLAGFELDKPRTLRGRREPVAVWSFRRSRAGRQPAAMAT